MGLLVGVSELELHIKGVLEFLDQNQHLLGFDQKLTASSVSMLEKLLVTHLSPFGTFSSLGYLPKNIVDFEEGVEIGLDVVKNAGEFLFDIFKDLALSHGLALEERVLGDHGFDFEANLLVFSIIWVEIISSDDDNGLVF